jgi:site-specific recombinase XerD
MPHLADGWQRFQIMRGLSPLTVKRRDQAVASFERHASPATLETATGDHVEAWLGSIPGAATRYHYLSDIRMFYRWAIPRGHVTADPTALIDGVKKPGHLPRPLGPEVERAVNEGTRRNRLMSALGLFAGLRCAEIAALHTDDVNLGAGVLVVRDGKGGKDRVVPLHPRLAAMLADVPAGWVAPWNGQRVSPRTVSVTLAAHLRRCGIDATAHQLRHTFGTELARRTNGDLVAVGKLMGHGSTETTKGYVGWSADMADVVAAMFSDDEGDAAA